VNALVIRQEVLNGLSGQPFPHAGVQPAMICYQVKIAEDGSAVHDGPGGPFTKWWNERRECFFLYWM